MAAEGWDDGTWCDWRWKTPDRRSSSSSSIPQAGWMLHDWGRPSFWSNQGWRQWNSLVDTTSSDPLQYGGERAEVIPPLDEVVAWWEAGLLDPREDETEETTHVGHWRQQKGSDERHAHGDSSSGCFTRRTSLASETARSTLCPRSGGPSRQVWCPTTSWKPSIRKRWP